MRGLTWKDVLGLIAAALLTLAAYVWVESVVYSPDVNEEAQRKEI